METTIKTNNAFSGLMSGLLSFAPVFASAVTLASAASAYGSYPVILHQHIGSNDPTTEGWVAVASGSSVGPVIDPAWSIVNNAPGDYAFYSAVSTAGEILDAATLGWSLQTCLRVTSPSLTPGGSMLSLYRDRITSYQMHFGSAANGDAIVVLADNLGGFDSATGPSYTVPGGSVYNTYELIYSPGDPGVDLFVNGVERISNFAGFALPLAQGSVAWGDGSTRDLTGIEAGTNISAANYCESVFSIVPEPSSLACLMWGIAILGVRRMRSDQA